MNDRAIVARPPAAALQLPASVRGPGPWPFADRRSRLAPPAVSWYV
jgi:hypothetical protein